VDWIKHCFVTKFNHLTPDLYRKYQTIICSDIVASRAKHGAFDHHYALSRRIGFVSMPLACLVRTNRTPHTAHRTPHTAHALLRPGGE
jgi:hypothetical protein